MATFDSSQDPPFGRTDTRQFYDQLRTELDQLGEELEALGRRQSALMKMVEGLRELYPWLADEDSVEDDESNRTVGEYLKELFQHNPADVWYTVRELGLMLPVAHLRDPEAAIRAALRRLGPALEQRNRDGRTLEYRLRPNLRGRVL